MIKNKVFKKIKKAAAIGFTIATLLSSNANAQQIYHGWIPPPVYYSPVVYSPFYYPPAYYPSPYIIWPPIRPFVRRVPLETLIGIRFPPPPMPLPRIHIPERQGRDERKGEETIRNYLLNKKINFRMNKLTYFETDRGRFSLILDFQLPGRKAIEYWSQGDREDSEYKKKVFEGFKKRFGQTIKPYDLWDKKDVYKEYKKTEGEVYFIEPKDIDPINLEQKLKPILEELTKKQFLSEREAEQLISIYLKRKGIPYKKNTTFTTEGITISPDFLIEFIGEKHFVVEYWGEEKNIRKRKEEEYRKYKEVGGKVYEIETTNKRGLLAKLKELIE